ncbi:hypothetical protein [Streptomyces javensis]|uniref:Uncharacterized protein n=1 Tax=Streptomyces javensis TaxID=114698 RepID=A0ABN1WDK9_9ACTN
MIIDGGGVVAAALAPIHGAGEVAKVRSGRVARIYVVRNPVKLTRRTYRPSPQGRPPRWVCRAVRTARTPVTTRTR